MYLSLCIGLFAATSFAQSADSVSVYEATHIKNMIQLTWGGDNAEAYFSFDDKNLSTQITNPKWGLSCDQIFNIDIAKAAKDTTYRPPLISTGKGRTTCSFFLPDGKHILYASTHLGGDSCPPPPAPREIGRAHV